MSGKKFKLVKEDTKEFFGKTLFRVKALKNFSNFKKGDLGGYIEKEENLSQEGNAWIYGNALVYGDAWVSDDALVFGNARVYGNAWVFGDALVFGDARVSGNLKVGCVLCSRFSFKKQKQLDKWLKLEKQFEKEEMKK